MSTESSSDPAAPRPRVATTEPPLASLLLESSNDWIWSFDAHGRLRYSNGAVERILGFTPEDLIATDDFSTRVHPDDLAAVSAALERSARNATPWQGEVFRWRHKDGTWRWLESHGNAMFDESGQLTGFCGADRDITDRVEHERQLADSERRFRMTFEQAGIGIAHVGTDGRWLRVNAPLTQMLGYETDELMQLTFQGITHPDDLDADVAEAQRLFAGEIPSYPMEKRYVRRDGSIIWASLTGSVVRDDAGAIEYAIAVIRDISARKEAEAIRRQSERDYRALFESSHDVVVLIDPATWRIVNANRRACELYGYTLEELIGSSIEILANDGEELLRHVGSVLLGGSQAQFHTTHKRRDGRLVDLQVTSALVMYGGRDVILTSGRDATKENRLARAVATSEQRFRSIIEHGYDMVEIVDATGRIRFVSGSVETALGYAPEELIGTSFADRLHPDDRQRVEAVFGSLLQSTTTRPTIVARVQAKSGEWRWCEGAGVNMLDMAGVEGIVIIARDITERVELEQRVEQARRVESLGRVAATVAHEFNNALMAMQPVADLLHRKKSDAPDMVQLARQLTAGIQRGRVIAGGILRFANPSDPVRENVALQPWLAAVTDELRSLVGRNVEVSATADESLVIKVDPDQLHQLILNLVINASDAMTAGGTIRIAATRVAGAGGTASIAEISVHDSGPGIAPELRERIFEPLFTTKRKGTGLGLSLCQQIVAAHGGSISVENGEGGGALFRVRLTAAPAQPRERDRKRLLLVEDDGDVAASLMLALEDSYEIEWTMEGRGVVEKVKAAEPDIVLLDVQLPDSDGREILAELRRARLTMPVVLMSGRTAISSRDLDSRAAFLSKPFGLDDLVRVTESLGASAVSF